MAEGRSSTALKSDGTVWAWGYNANVDVPDYRLPAQITGVSDVVALSAGGHILALKSDGTVWAWGFNDNSVDVFDLDPLIQAFNSMPGEANWNPNADFNCDESVDVFDLDILIRNFNAEGDL